MTTPTTGAISASDISVELSDWNLNKVTDRTSTQLLDLNDPEVRRLALITTAGSTISYSDLYNRPRAVSSFALVTSGTTTNLNGIAYGDSKWIAVGEAGLILRSLDSGTTWTTSVSGTTNILYGICYVKNLNLWIAVGASGKIITSPDGVTWTSRTSGTTNNLTGVSTNGSNAVINVSTSNAAKFIYTTTGTSYTLTSSYGGLSTNQPHWNGTMGKYVAGCEDGGIISFTPGTWTFTTIQGFISQSDNLNEGAWLSNGSSDYSLIVGSSDVNGKMQAIDSSTSAVTLVTFGSFAMTTVSGGHPVRGIQGKQVWFMGSSGDIARVTSASGLYTRYDVASTVNLVDGASDGYRVIFVGDAGVIYRSVH